MELILWMLRIHIGNLPQRIHTNEELDIALNTYSLIKK